MATDRPTDRITLANSHSNISEIFPFALPSLPPPPPRSDAGLALVASAYVRSFRPGVHGAGARTDGDECVEADEGKRASGRGREGTDILAGDRKILLSQVVDIS